MRVREFMHLRLLVAQRDTPAGQQETTSPESLRDVPRVVWFIQRLSQPLWEVWRVMTLSVGEL